MSSPQYCLRWNNHHPNFVSVFKNLLEDEELVDVTLSVDGQKIKAHKVILSACSPYFKLMFSANPCKHPLVILSDMKFTDLKTIIEFMYCGEINITDEQLPDILEAAEALQVRGLFDPNKKASKDQGLVAKKNKKEAASEMDLPQSDVPKERLDGYSNMNKSGATGCSMAEWMNEQTHENEFSSEYSTPIEGALFSPSVSFEEQLGGIFQSDQSLDTPPSPTDHPVTPPAPIRRRNSKVQQSENFHLALEAVRTGRLGFCKAAKLYGLNNRTLWLEYKKRGYPATRSQPVALKLKQTSSC